MKLLTLLYDKSPALVKDLMAITYGHALRRQRYDKTYRQELAFLQQTNIQPAEVLREIQQRRIKALVSHAIQRVTTQGATATEQANLLALFWEGRGDLG